jgi:hypothetical protein
VGTAWASLIQAAGTNASWLFMKAGSPNQDYAAATTTSFYLQFDNAASQWNLTTVTGTGRPESALALFAEASTGTNIAGKTLTLGGGAGTGNAAPGPVRFQVSKPLASGATAQTRYTVGELTNGSLLLRGHSSTVNEREMAAIEWLWNVDTDAVRQAELILSAWDTVKRRGVHVRASGTAPELGFLEADPIPRQAHIADPGDAGEALTAIAAMLDVLEGFGLVATS